jgi:hypothetical protein
VIFGIVEKDGKLFPIAGLPEALEYKNSHLGDC